MKSIKTLAGASALTAAILAGCANSDLLAELTLSADDQAKAMEIAQMAQMQCTTYSYDPASGRALSGQMIARELPMVKAFSRSDSGWYMAELMLNSTWDSVYYHPTKYQFVCGMIAWNKRDESQEVRFKKVAVAGSAQSAALPTTSAARPLSRIKEDRLIELKSLYGRGLITEIQYNEQVKEILSGR